MNEINLLVIFEVCNIFLLTWFAGLANLKFKPVFTTVSCGTKNSRMGQVKFVLTDHINSNVLKAVLYKFYSVYS